MSRKLALSQRGTQTAEQRQQQHLSPRMFQAMEILHLPLPELRTRLDREISENPFLEAAEARESVEGESALEAAPEDAEEEEGAGEEERLEETDLFEDFEDFEDRTEWGESYVERALERGAALGTSLDYGDPVVVRRPELADHLDEQLRLMRLGPETLLIAREIVGNLDARGLLGAEIEVVAEGATAYRRELLRDDAARENGLFSGLGSAPIHPREVERVLVEVVQTLDPPGIAARDVRESLLLQLKRRGRGQSLAYRILERDFDALANRRWEEIQLNAGASSRELQAARDEIARLDPNPGLRFAGGEDEYVVPDVIVRIINGEFHVFTNQDHLPPVHLSPHYTNIENRIEHGAAEEKRFIERKLNAAKWMIQLLEQRRKTILRVTRMIVERQRDFFEKGAQHLKPLALRDVASALDLSESTVSRVTSRKYVQSPAGVFPLKRFFSRAIPTATGESVSAGSVKERIRRLVENEDPARPLSDQAVVDALNGDGIRIARRTVGKYRTRMGILSARMRKNA